MKYLCLIHHDERALETMSMEAFGVLRGRYIEFTESIIAHGHFLAGEALQPTSAATTVRMRNGTVTTTDGPVVASRESVGGFYLLEARDLNEAIRIAARIPDAQTGSVEVRPVVDFAASSGG